MIERQAATASESRGKPSEDFIFERLAILGLGLIGGSFALAARTVGLAREIVAFDPDSRALAAARAAGAIMQGVASAARAVDGADVVVLAAPVRTIIALLPEIAPHLATGCLLMDLGSTKQFIVAAMNELPRTVRAVGGHPMAGKETAGFAAADATLFHGATWALCTTDRTDGTARALSERLVRAVGASPLWVDAAAHDQAVARVSHLPYALAATLAHVAAPEGLTRALAATGYRDSSRLAACDPTRMLDTFLTNRAALLAALDETRQTLDALRRFLDTADSEGLRAWMAAAQSKQ